MLGRHQSAGDDHMTTYRWWEEKEATFGPSLGSSRSVQRGCGIDGYYHNNHGIMI